MKNQNWAPGIFWNVVRFSLSPASLISNSVEPCMSNSIFPSFACSKDELNLRIDQPPEIPRLAVQYAIGGLISTIQVNGHTG